MRRVLSRKGSGWRRSSPTISAEWRSSAAPRLCDVHSFDDVRRRFEPIDANVLRQQVPAHLSQDKQQAAAVKPRFTRRVAMFEVQSETSIHIGACEQDAPDLQDQARRVMNSPAKPAFLGHVAPSTHMAKSASMARFGAPTADSSHTKRRGPIHHATSASPREAASTHRGADRQAGGP